jgi:hypothetical protein
MSYGLHYTRYLNVLEGYSDSNWIFDADEIKATSGYAFTLGGAAVSWRSCKQTIFDEVNHGSWACSIGCNHWRGRVGERALDGFAGREKPIPAILMYCDNETVITKVTSTKDNLKSSRHVKRQLKSVRKLRNFGVIAIDYVQTAKNMADPFTKGLSRNVIDSASKEMSLRPTWVTHSGNPNLCDRRSRESRFGENKLYM